MKSDVFRTVAADCAGFAFVMGGVIIFVGYFWPEMTGWVWLASIVGPRIGTVQIVLCVVTVATGVGLLKETDAARQITPLVCFLLAVGSLAIAGANFVQGSEQKTALCVMSYTACGFGTLFFGILGGIMLPARDRGKGKPEAPAPDAAAQEQARALLQRRTASLASWLSLVLGVSAPPVAAAVTCSPQSGLRWAMAVPSVLLCNAAGAGLGWAAVKHGEESSWSRKAAVAGMVLNLLPFLITFLIVVLKRRGYSA